MDSVTKVKEILKENTAESLYDAWSHLDVNSKRVLSDIEFYIHLGHIMRSSLLSDDDLQVLSQFNEEEINKLRTLSSFIIYKNKKSQRM